MAYDNIEKLGTLLKDEKGAALNKSISAGEKQLAELLKKLGELEAAANARRADEDARRKEEETRAAQEAERAAQEARAQREREEAEATERAKKSAAAPAPAPAAAPEAAPKASQPQSAPSAQTEKPAPMSEAKPVQSAPKAAQPQPANWRITCPIFPGFVCAIFSAPNVNVSLKARPCSNGSQRFAQTNARHRTFGGKARRRMQHPSPSKRQCASAVCRIPTALPDRLGVFLCAAVHGVRAARRRSPSLRGIFTTYSR